MSRPINFARILIGGTALCAAFTAVAPATAAPAVALAGYQAQGPDLPDDGGSDWSTTLSGGGQIRPSAPQNNDVVACTALECRPDIPGYKPRPGPEQRFAPEPEEHRSEIDQMVQRIMDWLERLLGQQPEVPPMPLPRPIPEPMPLPRPIPDPKCKVEPAVKGDTADSGVAVLRCPTEK